MCLNLVQKPSQLEHDPKEVQNEFFPPCVDINHNNNNDNNDFSKVNDVSKGAEMVLIEGIYPKKLEKHTHTLTSTMSTLLVTCEKKGKKKIRERSPLNFNTVQAKQK